jgi:hypothetical protein
MRDVISSFLGTAKGVLAGILPQYRKAIVGFLVAAFVSFLARNGYNLTPDVSDAVMTLVDAVFIAFMVFLVPNSKK